MKSVWACLARTDEAEGARLAISLVAGRRQQALSSSSAKTSNGKGRGRLSVPSLTARPSLYPRSPGRGSVRRSQYSKCLLHNALELHASKLSHDPIYFCGANGFKV